MNIYAEVVQWIFAGAGSLAAIYSYFFNRRLNAQKHDLDKLKSKFDYLLLERNKVFAALNTRVSDIEVWLAKSSRHEDADWIDVDEFRSLVDRFEITLIHGQYLLNSNVFQPADDLYNHFRKCINVYDDELEKIGYAPLEVHPKATLANMLYDVTTKESIDLMKKRLSKELEDE